MADYRDHYQQIRAGGADVVAISVDRPDQSERLRRDLKLPFTILSDADRRVIGEWDIFNQREHRGIAKPSVFVVDTNRNVLFSSVDGVRNRMGASEIAQMLHTRQFPSSAARRAYTPHFGDFVRGLQNLFRR